MSKEVLNRAALDLEECVPQQHSNIAVGGLIGDILALAAAVKSGDVNAIIAAVAKLFQDLTGSGTTPTAACAAAGLNWQNILAIIMKILGALPAA